MYQLVIFLVLVLSSLSSGFVNYDVRVEERARVQNSGKDTETPISYLRVIQNLLAEAR